METEVVLLPEGSEGSVGSALTAGCSRFYRRLTPTSVTASCLLTANTKDQQNAGLKDLRFVEEAVGRVRGHQLGYNGHDDYDENRHQLKKRGIGVLERTTRASREKRQWEKAASVRRDQALCDREPRLTCKRARKAQKGLPF